MEENWEEMKGNSGLWLPSKPGDFLEGSIIALSQGLYGVQADVDAGNLGILRTPSHKVLQAKLKDCKIGDYVKIIYEKTDLPKVKGQHGAMLYKVMRKDIPTEKV